MALDTLLASVLPALILAGYIILKDKASPEPVKMLLAAFCLGMLSAPASMLISCPLGWIGAYSDDPSTLSGLFLKALYAAAVPEETAKFIALWIVVRRNGDFNEYFDGLVYAVCVSMGFAALENIMYLADAGENWMNVGLMRGILSVPSHYADAVLRGFFFSLAMFGSRNTGLNGALTLLAPILAHALFDWVCFSISASSASGSFITVTVIAGLAAFIWLQRLVRRKVREHLALDNGERNGTSA